MKEKIQPRKQPSQTRSRERVEKIISATYALLQEQGLAAVTTVHIAKKAGVSVGSVYQYFPNKKAIFVSLYNEYLKDIRSILDDFDNEPYTSMGWEAFFVSLHSKLSEKENEQNILPELEQAFHLYPEMREVDIDHSNVISERIVNFLSRYDFPGSKEKLTRLSHFIYSINGGFWDFRSKISSKYHGEANGWELAAIMGVLTHYRNSLSNNA
ncbi:TetR/AcrR family transcriptional regulator [Thalassotalea castellviae]|uniref:TetR/AcrR family transcriptional regulator n=1 Tax=Thalassotalea castellviae TaxID=3075612 RepID=A0ABU3A138_9GAMM|nr:TetR/AcrR family transcriptional regulator [Thalassotalea sp. W431]MDT0603892.1 TetR/AcrR family transcriptional regulator [Thalassotalea sp. W431]